MEGISKNMNEVVSADDGGNFVHLHNYSRRVYTHTHTHKHTYTSQLQTHQVMTKTPQLLSDFVP